MRVNVPSPTAENAGQPGDRVQLFTSLQVREASLTLFGFLAEEGRMAFETLVSVNGVGPRLALGVLSRFTPESLASAVSSGDTAAFNGVPGVGKKTASRIVLELRGKLDDAWATGPTAMARGELIDALVALGYTASEAHEAASSISAGDSLSLEERVRLALERMANA